MGRFVEFAIDDAAFPDVAARERCARACPVDVLTVERGQLGTVPENEDECILCGLCVAAAPPGALTVRRAYGSRAAVEARR